MLPASIDAAYDFSVTQCGFAAWSHIQPLRIGRIAAVFDSSFYIEFDGVLICIVGSEVPVGPINLVAGFPASMRWRSSGLQVGNMVRVTRDRRIVGPAFDLDVTDALIWRPPPLPKEWSATSLREGLDALESLMEDQWSAAELVRLVLQEWGASGRSDFDCFGFAQFREACRFIWDAPGKLEDDTLVIENGAICRLVGVGGGLTPAGDDFLGGVLFVLKALGCRRSSEHIRGSVLTAAEYETNRISLAHLRCASQGAATEPVHRFLSALLQGRSLKVSRLASDIDRIGHTSGWDFVAGMICVLKLLQSDEQGEV